LIYGTAFFAVAGMIGVFWWFGAPGSPPNTGLRYFPGQDAGQYVPRWYAMEPGSERAEYFESTNDLGMLETPEEYLGDVMGDLNSRRGRVEGLEPRGNAQAIRARVPLATMFGYATDLRSTTQGRATFTMQFDRYEEAPQAIAGEIVAAAQGS
jgi:hypothetical protein